MNVNKRKTLIHKIKLLTFLLKNLKFSKNTLLIDPVKQNLIHPLLLTIPVKSLFTMTQENHSNIANLQFNRKTPDRF